MGGVPDSGTIAHPPLRMVLYTLVHHPGNRFPFMSLIMEVIHTVRPATPANFEKYVVRYGEVAVPLMERCGFDLLGGFQWSTGERGRDLLLVRFDSVAHYDQATTQLMRELADPDTVKGLMELGLEIEEYVRLGDTLPYATEARLQTVLDNPPEAPRQYMLARLKAPLAALPQALDAVGRLVDRVEGGGTELVTAYSARSGARGEFTDLWVLPESPLDLSFRTGAPVLAELDEAFGAVETEFLDYVNPLPYSRLR